MFNFNFTLPLVLIWLAQVFLCCHGLPAASPKIPPSPFKDITLYHGTQPHLVASLMNGIDLKKTEPTGDFSRKGGFYLTDTMRAAGQYVCQTYSSNTMVTIFEYTWAGASVPAGEILEFKKKDIDWDNFCHVNLGGNEISRQKHYRDEADKLSKDKIMISGPMGLVVEMDDLLTEDYWQYGIVDQKAVPKLARVKVHQNIPCTKFPAGQLHPSDTQGPSAHFSQEVKVELGI